MYVIKKDNTHEPWNVQKVVVAVNKSAYRALVKFTQEELDFICDFVETKAKSLGKEGIPIAEMHNIVEGALEQVKPEVAKSYRDYRNYKQDFVKMLDDYYNNRKGIKIVQLNGNVASNILSVKAYDIVEKFQSAFSATGYLFPLPILVDNRDTARALLNDSRIKPIIDIARQADVAILSVGKLSKKSLIFERGVLNEQDYKELSRAGAVGDICSRYFDAAGNIVDNDLNARVLGLTLEELKRIKNRMVIAVGEDKVHAILGALRTGVINKLYIDERTAAKVIHLSEA